MWHTDPKDQQRLKYFSKTIRFIDIATFIWRNNPLPQIFLRSSRRRNKEGIQEINFISLDNLFEEVR